MRLSSLSKATLFWLGILRRPRPRFVSLKLFWIAACPNPRAGSWLCMAEAVEVLEEVAAMVTVAMAAGAQVKALAMVVVTRVVAEEAPAVVAAPAVVMGAVAAVVVATTTAASAPTSVGTM